MCSRERTAGLDAAYARCWPPLRCPARRSNSIATSARSSPTSCFTCHGPDAANRKTKLRFDTEAGARIDLGKGRFAIVPGDPERSELFRRITSADTAVRMPPPMPARDPLTPAEIDRIRRWIAQGAHWQPFWSFIPPQRPAAARSPRRDVGAQSDRPLHPRPPGTRGPASLARSRQGDADPPRHARPDRPAADARRGRRLPRTTTRPTPTSKVVDRLLASPRYGERMAFRWLDAARYADTNGYQTDGPRDMWRWRDWVIDAFNRNMPFDQFTIEQLAGDLLPNATLDQRIATGFNRNHRTNGEGGIIPEEYRVEYVADRAQTTATVWLGLTVGCARCHDHKYDPHLAEGVLPALRLLQQRSRREGLRLELRQRGAVRQGAAARAAAANWPSWTRKIAAAAQRTARCSRTASAQRSGNAQARRRRLDRRRRAWFSAAGRRAHALRRQALRRRPTARSPTSTITHPFTFAAWIKPETPERRHPLTRSTTTSKAWATGST